MKKVALVEDNADNRLLVQVVLGDLFDVALYENGQDALDGFAKDKPDAILLDISLPRMDGNEVLRRIRADEALCGLPVIALTAHAMTGDREKYIDAGFDDYVTKPILDEEVLISTIRRFLEPGGHGE
jgi:two-component system, cell cycle response regulator DivK